MPSKYQQSIPLDHMDANAFVGCAASVCKALEWDIDVLTPHGIIAYTKNLRYPSRMTIRLEEETIHIESESIDSSMIDWGRNKKRVNLFIDTFYSIKGQFHELELVAVFKEQIASFEPADEDILDPAVHRRLQKNNSFLQLFIPSRGYVVTPVLFLLNIIYFIIMVAYGVHILLPEGQDILTWGGNYGPSTLNGEWWRLLSCTFVHIGIMHLLMNMYALLYIGSLLEPLLGSVRFLAAYLLTGITSSLLSLYIHPDIVSAGASGAIFGMFGVFAAMLTTNLISKTARNAILPSIGLYIGYNLLYGMKQGVDNAGHLGGLIGGLVLGYAFYPSLKNRSKLTEYITIGISSIIVILITFFSFPKVPNTSKALAVYDEKFQKFAEFESMALEVAHTNMPDKEDLLHEIKDRGIYYWDECIKVIKEADELHIPDVLHQRDKKLLEYCTLRKNMYELAYKQIEQDSKVYQPQIDSMGNEIEDILDWLKQPPGTQ